MTDAHFAGYHGLHISREYIACVLNALGNLNFNDPVRIANILHRVRDTGGTVYVAGNGGSAANALHLAGHLTMLGFRVECPIANPVALTAASNDYGYDVALARQIHSMPAGANVTNALVVLSCSGNSRNVTGLIKLFKSVGERYRPTIIALTGNIADPNYSELEADISLKVASDHYGVIEDVHSVAIHIIRQLLTDMGLTEPAR